MSSSTESAVRSTPRLQTGSVDSEALARPQSRGILPAHAALDRLETGHAPGIWTWSHSDLRFLGVGLLICASLLATQWRITAGLTPAPVAVHRGQAVVPARSLPQGHSNPKIPVAATTALAAVTLPDSQTSSLFQVEMNEADWVAWSQLDGIGEKLAQRIVADREQQGPFQSIEDLLRVKGIGPKTLARLRPHLRLSPTNPSAGSPVSE